MVFIHTSREEVQVSPWHSSEFASEFASDTQTSSAEESYHVPLDANNLGSDSELHFDESLSVFGLVFRQISQQSDTRGALQPAPTSMSPETSTLFLFLLLNFSEILFCRLLQPG